MSCLILILYFQAAFQYPFDSIKVRKSGREACQGAKQNAIHNTVIRNNIPYLPMLIRLDAIYRNRISLSLKFSPRFHVSIVLNVRSFVGGVHTDSG